MAKKIVFSKEQREEIRMLFCKRKKIKDVKSYNRIVVLNMRRLGYSNKEIHEKTDLSIQYITEIVILYNKKGMESVIGNHYTSHNRNLDFDEESAFLEQFRDDAEAGLIITIDKILEKYEEKIEKKSNSTTIYRLLKRHGWRKVKPCPKHPESATEEERIPSKKLTQNGKKSYWKIMSNTTVQ